MKTEKTKKRTTPDQNRSGTNGSSIREKFSTEKYPNTDFIDRLMRFGVSVVTAGFTSGLLAGLIEGITEFDLSFGSPVSLGLFAVLFISFWTLFSIVGRFKNKLSDMSDSVMKFNYTNSLLSRTRWFINLIHSIK